jgi:hypothetical protein
VTLVALSPSGRSDFLELTGFEAFDNLPRFTAQIIDIHWQVSRVERLVSMWTKIATDDRIYL